MAALTAALARDLGVTAGRLAAASTLETLAAFDIAPTVEELWLLILALLLLLLRLLRLL